METTNTLQLAMQEGALDASFIKDARLRNQADELIALQLDALNGVKGAVDTVSAIQRKQAAIMAEIAVEGKYKDTGAKSIGDFGKRLGLGKSYSYMLANAGKIYADNTVPEKLKALPPSKLAEIQSVLKADKEDIYVRAERGDFDGLSQKELRETAQNITKERMEQNGNAEPVTTYILREMNGETDEQLETPSVHGYTIEEIETALKARGEVVKLPNGKVSADSKKATIRRYVVITTTAATVYHLYEYRPSSNGQVMTTAKRDMIIAAAKGEGMDTDAINAMLKVLGLQPIDE